jgi:hypothetical protein
VDLLRAEQFRKAAPVAGQACQDDEKEMRQMACHYVLAFAPVLHQKDYDAGRKKGKRPAIDLARG